MFRWIANPFDRNSLCFVLGALFLEFTPKKNQYLLTFLSIFFSFGAVATSILGYLLLPTYSCETHVEGGCQGRGWRYMLLALGGLVSFTMTSTWSCGVEFINQ